MDNFVFLDSKFDLNKTHTYNLSIQVSLGGFSFSIHSLEGECLALKRSINYSNAKSYSLKELFSLEELFDLQYHSVKFLVDVGKTSLVPDKMFDKNKLDYYQTLCFGSCENEVLLYDYVTSIQSYFLYSVPELLWLVVNDKFSNFEIVHSMSSFISSVEVNSMKVEYPNVYVMISDEKLHVYIPGVDLYSFYNSYVFKTDSDLVYYLLNIYEEKSLSSLYSELKIRGELSNVAFPMLEKYIKSVVVERVIENDLVEIDSTKFINLLKLYK